MWSSERRDMEDKMTYLDDLIEQRDRAEADLRTATLEWLANLDNPQVHKTYLRAHHKAQLAQARVLEEGIRE